MMKVVAAIVEGHGDVESLPTLLRLFAPSLRIPTPVRVPKSKMLNADTGPANSDEIGKYSRIALANIRRDEKALLLLLLDADSDCPATVGPSLLEAMRHTAGHACECYAAFAVREFESWIVGGHPDIDVQSPESAGSPKNRLADINGGKYKESVDQPKFTSKINVQRLQERSPSFRRLFDRIREFEQSNGPD